MYQNPQPLYAVGGDGIRTAGTASEHEYRLYREWYEREEKPESCYLSALAVPAATFGCLLVTLLLGGAL